MADAAAAADLIEARLRAAWTATPLDRLRFENGPLIDMTVLAPFCQVEIFIGEDRPYVGQPGARMNRADGVILLHLMVPQLDGTSAVRAMFANARRALANGVFGGVYTQGAAPNRGRPSSEDGSYWGSTAAIPFFYLYHDAA